MTSLAVLPLLKRTMTDMMDEELYQIPSSPIFTTTNNNNNNGKQEGAGDNYNDGFNLNNTTTTTNYNHTSNRNSVSSSPNLPFAQLNTTRDSFYNNNANQNNSSNNLGNMLNIPDSFLEQITTKEGIDQFKLQQQQQNQQTLIPDSEYPQDSQSTYINPFTNYANPNSFIRPSQAFSQQTPLYRSQSQV